MFKNYILVGPSYINKKQEKIYKLKFKWSGIIRTKDPIKTLNRLGDLFYFTPQYLKQKGLINNLDLLLLSGFRYKYGRIKACLLELK